jgi:hypothetical protein
MSKQNAVFSTMVRAGRTTYFVDVREAKNGNKYLSITESRFNGDEKQKTTIRVFGDAVQEFRQAVSDAAAAVS